MTHRKRIRPKYLPPRLPVAGTAIVWLLMDRLHPPGWAAGAAWAVVAMVWLAVAVELGQWVPSHPKDV